MKIKIDFKNEKTVNGEKRLQFYEKYSNEKELLEFAYITAENENIIYHTDEMDIKKFPKEQLNDFIINLYNKILVKQTGERADTKNKTSVAYFSLRMFSSNFPLVHLFFIHKGILNTLKYFNIRYSKSTIKDNKAFLSVRLTSNGKSGYLNIYAKNTMDEYLINGIRKDANKLFPIDEKDLNNKKIMEKFFSDYYSLNKYLNLKAASTYFIDVTTKKVLEGKHNPSDFFEVFGKFMPDKLINGKLEDVTDLKNQRIRMSESIAHLAYKVLTQAIIHMKNNKGQYNIKLDIDPNFITKELQSSGMLQYVNSINPLAELLMSNKITKTGVGNPKKDQITLPKRDLNPSYYGTISPLTTNEYGGIGINQTLTNRSIIKDRFGNILVRPFEENLNSTDMLSVSESISPFLEYSDTTRVVMGMQQISQFAQIEQPDEPLIQTGMESIVPQLTSDKFAIKAKNDGKIIDVLSDNELTILYKNGHKEIFSLKDILSRTARGVYLPMKLTPLVKKGQVVKKGQLLAATSSLKSGILSFGKNLVIALMSYRGMNYEDGWAVSEAIGDKFKSTLIKKILIPIDADSNIINYNIELNKKTKPGENLIEFTNANNTNIENIVNNASEDSIKDIKETDESTGGQISTGRHYKNGNIVYNSPGGTIKNINILLNTKTIDNKLLNEWKLLNSEIQKKLKRCSKLTDVKQQLDCRDKIDNIKSSVIGNHKINNTEFNGTIIELYIEYPNHVRNGSKFTLLGSSGGKGTIQYQIPRGKEPIAVSTNLKIEFIPTPISNISRKNINVLLSLYSGKIVYFVNKLVKDHIQNGKFKEAEKILIETYSYLDKTKDGEIISQLKEFFKDRKNIIKIVKESDPLHSPAFPLLVTPFKNKLLMSDIKKAAQHLNLPLNEKVKIIEEDGVITEKSVPVGIAPIAMLEHFPDAAAGIRGSINSKKSQMTGQGRSGTKEGNGAIRIGLYDMFGLTYKKNTKLLKELHFMKSDNLIANNKLNNYILKTGKSPSQEELNLDEETEKLSKTKHLIKNYFYGALLEPKF